MKSFKTIYKKDYNSFIKGFCDSDYAGDKSSAKSTSGYIFIYGNDSISWRTKLQSVVAQNTAESELIAINLAAKEAIYLRRILVELNQYNQEKFPIWTDNTAAKAISENAIYHDKSKHIDTKYYYIRDLINKGLLDLNWISTNNQIADGLTKPLDRIKLSRFIDMIQNYNNY